MSEKKYRGDGYKLQLGDQIEESYCGKIMRTMRVSRFTERNAVCETSVRGVNIRWYIPRVIGLYFQPRGAGPALVYRVLA